MGDTVTVIMLKRLVLCFGLALVLGEPAKVRYDGYYTLSVGPLKNHFELGIVDGLIDQDERQRQVISIDDHVTKEEPITLFVSPERQADVIDTLRNHDINVEVLNEDLQKHFDQNMRLNTISKAMFKTQHSLGRPVSNAPSYYM